MRLLERDEIDTERVEPETPAPDREQERAADDEPAVAQSIPIAFLYATRISSG